MTAQPADKVQRSFSRSFDTYHDTASQQAWVADKLVSELRRVGAPGQFRTAFEMGCGTGHLTRTLRQNFDLPDLVLNDIAPQAQATADAEAAVFIAGDVRMVQWPGQIDLIASASMIQWMDDPTGLLQQAVDALAPGGWLAISGFGPQQYKELTSIGSTAQAPGLCGADALVAAIEGSMRVLTAGERIRPSYFETPRDVLKYLRRTGVNGRAQGAWTKSTLARFEKDYVRSFATDDGVSLTYHPVWIIAQKQ
ncbi:MULTISPECIES: methyltransferase domain-containing protein [unclassified Ruegeria]|uniref:methyltransferase domain-containing protein n=1 Tax=unclassified Ruegeria TaxID=2625375 RepID=UPI00148908FD|nr:MULTISPECIES: methyltransferase domain-containing protein [unclassified Ruegeria]NOD34369.1 methyltransferase domain-containing protein [Ruegeria sp. HKCCD7296]NOD47489.1 methyltransferase domain-containing protein [Ruegeria sp. HKCCD5849]NOD53118.1 methyltransferase domain-containing protein [Ruegeria sp. HKCCD5851]NOD66311.1 methyltransferase domain-containing protein [Ruegeria sp. HKCCD7303]NOE34200.1 methyltransferase domain-containing protein [Ruegeria sp. HKCCD7318]